MSFKGRTFADTWGARKVATELIENPVDVLEHVKRLSDWSELGTSLNWGSEYEPGALIDTAAFDSAELNDIKALKIARQYTGAVDTDQISRSICEAFFMVSKITPAGHETVIGLGDDGVADPQVVTIDELKSMGEMIEPRMQDVFVEPSIRYAYDQATGKYTKSMAVTNVSAAQWLQEYTPGFNHSDGYEAWLWCREVAKTYKIVEPMPSNLSDQPWITDYNTALWRIRKIIDWMQKLRCDISVNWDRGRLWGVGTYISIQHPHRTNDDVLKCVIEDIRKNKRNDTVSARIVFVDNRENDPIANLLITQNTSELEYPPSL